ncbi:hypothetical protein A2228_02610 [Candidatus Collierbacteria bacterium RIFOXYA2_FULL_46_10]|uniref:Uncharacterized protein n=1 Tax=Candidatus Collierbacteria bacterium RIFOXYA2_FULL_46_10 TaxID=1817726 RepID=A0A1F5F3Z0_9BACT|nr:MAG: hypothetical protein A2228_02610 [Candidatus Collierbacteria bacterium RIFOXYA2_FULL_46_10]
MSLTLIQTVQAAESFRINIDDQVKSRVAINDTLGVFVQKSFSAVILVAGLATFMYLVLGGVQWIMAGGDKGKLEEAKGAITNGLIGLAVLAASYVIIKFLQAALGLDLLNILWPTAG